MTAAPVVRIEDLHVAFPRRGGMHAVFRGASLAIRRGELVCLLGPSGSGKSVLLNILIGALRHGHGGAIVRGGQEILGADITARYPAALSRRIGIVFQENALFEDLSSRENVEFPLRRRRLPAAQVRARAEGLLRDVDLPDPPRRVHELSGGQKKRLALARTLAMDPEFLIFDEPTAGLDPHLARQIAGLIARTHAEGRGERTTLIVTHDHATLGPLADRLLLLDPASGTIREFEAKSDVEAALAGAAAGRACVLQPAGGGARVLGRAASALAAPWRWLAPAARFAGRPFPGSGRQLLLRLADALVLPALYVCAASAVLGGLATFFALENNPLKGAMDRQALRGLGQVFISIAAPLVGSVLFAARVGAGAAARLGNIKLGRQDESLRTLGANPTAHLVTPLFWACLAGLPILTVPVLAAGSLASVAVACASRPITPFGWASAFFVDLVPADLGFGLVKLIGSGGLVAASAAYFGLRPKADSEDLGRDVTGTIVAGTFLVILWHGAMTFVQFAP